MRRSIASCLMAVLAAVPAAAASSSAPEAGAAGALANLPIKEVTVFKDGHAFVLHEGRMPTDDAGRVVLDYLLAPVLGTFWPYAADAKKARMVGVTAGKRILPVRRTSLTVAELIEGNPGAKVRIREAGAKDEKAPRETYEATIVGIPARSTDELARTGPPGAEPRLPERSGLVLLRTAGGVKAVPMAGIEDLTFLEGPDPGVAREEFRNVLTLQMDWGGRKPDKTADVGMVYLQRGIRWIPNYRVEIDGKGTAHVRLQATLLNELADLRDVRAHLVIGVPTFAFKETVDPISLQQAVAQLSSYFRQDAQTAYAFSNTIMTQAARMTEARAPAEGPPPGGAAADLGPDVAAGRKNEDLYIFTLDRITLKKGERMVVTVAEYDLPYKDVYLLDLAFGPPPEARQRFNSNQQLELARLMAAPKAVHNVRLTNKSVHPLTTAPAMIFRDGRALAQGMMKYTAAGAVGDLEVTAAVDIAVEKREKETGRVPNAANWHGSKFDRVDLAGNIHLVNHRQEAVQVEVTRHILGIVDSAGQNGRVEQASWTEGGWANADALPPWWSWYGWGAWWYEFNGLGRITWKIALEPGKSIDLEYAWHYFWG